MYVYIHTCISFFENELCTKRKNSLQDQSPSKGFSLHKYKLLLVILYYSAKKNGI